MRKNLMLIASVALAALILTVSAWPGTLPVSLIPDGARWIAHLDMEKLVATKFFEYLDTEGRFEIKNRDITRMLRMDIPKDIAGVTVFGLGPGEKQAVFAVTGKFDKERLLTLADLNGELSETAYGAFTIYSAGNDEFACFVNDGLIVFSESREAVEKVLDAAAGKAKNFSSSKLHAALKDAPSGAFLSGVVEDLTGLGREIRQSRIIEMAKGMLFMAQEKGESFQVRLQVTADSPESAKNMAEIVQGLVALARLGQSEGHRAVPASLVDGLQVKQDGTIVRLEIDVPSKDLADMLSHGRGMGLSLSAFLR